MLRFPTSIPIRPAEFDKFKEEILSQRNPRNHHEIRNLSDPRDPIQADKELVDRERQEIQERAKRSKAQRVAGL